MHTAAGVFGAAAASICLVDETTGELVYQSAWGAGAREIVGVRLPPGTGIAGQVVSSGVGEAVPDCRTDPPLRRPDRRRHRLRSVHDARRPAPARRRPIGALSILDRRDGRAYRNDDLEPAALFADLAVKALDVTPDSFTSLGMTRLGYRATADSGAALACTTPDPGVGCRAARGRRAGHGNRGHLTGGALHERDELLDPAHGWLDWRCRGGGADRGPAAWANGTRSRRPPGSEFHTA